MCYGVPIDSSKKQCTRTGTRVIVVDASTRFRCPICACLKTVPDALSLLCIINAVCMHDPYSNKCLCICVMHRSFSALRSFWSSVQALNWQEVADYERRTGASIRRNIITGRIMTLTYDGYLCE